MICFSFFITSRRLPTVGYLDHYRYSVNKKVETNDTFKVKSIQYVSIVLEPLHFILLFDSLLVLGGKWKVEQNSGSTWTPAAITSYASRKRDYLNGKIIYLHQIHQSKLKKIITWLIYISFQKINNIDKTF